MLRSYFETQAWGVGQSRGEPSWQYDGVDNRAQGTAHSMAESTAPICMLVVGSVGDSVASCLWMGISTSTHLTANFQLINQQLGVSSSSPYLSCESNTTQLQPFVI